MTFFGATERRHSFPLFLQILALFLTFYRLNAAGQIDLTIRHLTLRRAPPGVAAKVYSLLSPSSFLPNCLSSPPFDQQLPNDNFIDKDSSSSVCALHFRLCVSSVDHLSFSTFGTLSRLRNCDIISRNFSAVVQSARPFDSADRTFVAAAPFGVVYRRRFDFTSPLTANVSVHLSVLSSNNKLLLFSRFSAQLPTTAADENAQTFQYVNFGNVLLFQLKAKCADGSVGQKCTEICAPPKPGDHYFCAVDGMRCVPGWGGTRCLQPICESQCANGGRCVLPNHCECLSGWTGERCDQCIPKKGCQNGYCTDEQPGSCICLPNWTGSNCDVLINKCLQKPCKNGGICTTDGANGDFFRCICPAGFTGKDCAISFANCKNATCAAQSQHCVPLENGFTCVCLPGFAGPNCAFPQQNENSQKGQMPTNGHNLGKQMFDTDDKQSEKGRHPSTEQNAKSKRIWDDKSGGEMHKIYVLILNGVCIVFFLLFGVCVICNCCKSKFNGSEEKKKKKPTVGRLITVIAPGAFTTKASDSQETEKTEENGGKTPLFLAESQNLDHQNKTNDQKRTGKSFKSLVVRAMAASRGELSQHATDVERQQSDAPGAADFVASGASPPSAGALFASGVTSDRPTAQRCSPFSSRRSPTVTHCCSMTSDRCSSVSSFSADTFDPNNNNNDMINNKNNDQHHHSDHSADWPNFADHLDSKRTNDDKRRNCSSGRRTTTTTTNAMVVTFAEAEPTAASADERMRTAAKGAADDEHRRTNCLRRGEEGEVIFL